MSDETKWLVVKDRETGFIEVIPTSKPFHDSGPTCWCGAKEDPMTEGLWIHNEPN